MAAFTISCIFCTCQEAQERAIQAVNSLAEDIAGIQLENIHLLSRQRQITDLLRAQEAHLNALIIDKVTLLLQVSAAKAPCRTAKACLARMLTALASTFTASPR